MTSRHITKLVVVGSGPWAERHIITISRINSLKLLGVISRSIFSGQRGCPKSMRRVPIWPDILTMKESSIKPDGIVLAVEPIIYPKLISMCLAERIPVLVEKPLSFTRLGAIAITEEAKAQNTLLMVNFIHLFSQGFSNLCKQLSNVQSPLEISATGGGLGPFRSYMSGLWDYGPHELAFALHLSHEKPNSVVAERLIGNAKKHVISAVLTFPNGTVAQLKFGNLMNKKERRLTCIGSFGVLELIDYPDPNLAVNGINNPILGPRPLDRVLLAFSENIQSGRDIFNTAELAVTISDILEQIEKNLN